MDHSFHRQQKQKIVSTKQPLTVKFFIQDVFFVLFGSILSTCVKTQICHKSWQRTRKPSTSHVKGVISWSISSCHRNRYTSVLSQYCNISYHKLHFYHIILYHNLSSSFLCHCNQKHTRALQLMIPLIDWSPFNFKRRQNISILGVFQLLFSKRIKCNSSESII